MRHTAIIATTAFVTAIVSSWGTTVILAQSARKATVAVVSVPSHLGPTADRRAPESTIDLATDTSWSRWPSVTDF